MTHRQHEAWQQFLEEEWNRPSRSDWYAMQAAWAVAGALGGSRARLEDFQLQFRRTTDVPKENVQPESVQQETQWAQKKWFAALGYHGSRS